MGYDSNAPTPDRHDSGGKGIRIVAFSERLNGIGVSAVATSNSHKPWSDAQAEVFRVSCGRGNSGRGGEDAFIREVHCVKRLFGPQRERVYLVAERPCDVIEYDRFGKRKRKQKVNKCQRRTSIRFRAL